MSAYVQRLDEIRKKYDIWPWLEMTQGAIPIGAGANPNTPLAIQEPYKILWKEMPFIAWDVYDYPDAGPNVGSGLNDNSIGAYLYNWWRGGGISKVQASQNQVIVEDLLGSYNDEWAKIPRGMFMDKDELWEAQAYLSNAYNGGSLIGSGQIYNALRGYRLYEKNSIEPLQLSRREMLKTGKYRPLAYNYAQTVTVTFAPYAGSLPYTGQLGQLADNSLSFASPQGLHADFMCHSLRIRVQQPPVKITGGAPTAPFNINAFMAAVLVNVIPQSRVTAFAGGQFGQTKLTAVPWQMVMGVDFNQFTYGQTLTPTVYFNPVPRLATEWRFDHPITMRENEWFNITATPLTLPPNAANGQSYTMVLEFIFSGELLAKK